MFLAALALNVLAWKSSSFCDFYAESVFPVWSSIFHAGDVGFSVQRRRGHDRAGNFVPDSVCSCRILRLTVKKRGAKIVSQLFLHIFLDFSGTRLGYDL